MVGRATASSYEDRKNNCVSCCRRPSASKQQPRVEAPPESPMGGVLGRLRGDAGAPAADRFAYRPGAGPRPMLSMALSHAGWLQ